MELAAILGPIFAFVLIKNFAEHYAKERQDKLRVLEEAMRNPALDRAAIVALTQQLTGARPPGVQAARMMAMVLALGWLTLFTGLGIWVFGATSGEPDANAAGLLVALIGFGVVTYPFALRELDARRTS